MGHVLRCEVAAVGASGASAEELVRDGRRRTRNAGRILCAVYPLFSCDLRFFGVGVDGSALLTHSCEQREGETCSAPAHARGLRSAPSRIATCPAGSELRVGSDHSPNRGGTRRWVVLSLGTSQVRNMERDDVHDVCGCPYAGSSFALSTLRYPFVWRKWVLNGYSSTRVSLWDSLMFGRLAMGFANVRAGYSSTETENTQADGALPDVLR